MCQQQLPLLPQGAVSVCCGLSFMLTQATPGQLSLGAGAPQVMNSTARQPVLHVPSPENGRFRSITLVTASSVTSARIEPNAHKGNPQAAQPGRKGTATQEQHPWFTGASRTAQAGHRGTPMPEQPQPRALAENSHDQAAAAASGWPSKCAN